MSSEPDTPQPASETPSPERAKALQSLAALDLGDDLELQGLVCDPDDPDCVIEGIEAPAVSSMPVDEGATRSE